MPGSRIPPTNLFTLIFMTSNGHLIYLLATGGPAWIVSLDLCILLFAGGIVGVS